MYPESTEVFALPAPPVQAVPAGAAAKPVRFLLKCVLNKNKAAALRDRSPAGLFLFFLQVYRCKTCGISSEKPQQPVSSAKPQQPVSSAKPQPVSSAKPQPASSAKPQPCSSRITSACAVRESLPVSTSGPLIPVFSAHALMQHAVCAVSRQEQKIQDLAGPPKLLVEQRLLPPEIADKVPELLFVQPGL